MNRPEQALQKAVAEFLRLAVKRPARWWHVPNQGNRGAPRKDKNGNRKAPVEAAILKGLGVQAGVSDLHFVWATGALGQFPCFACIELKVGKEKESDDQERFGKDLLALNHGYAVCRSVEDVERTLRSWSFPLHATVLKSGVIQQKVA